VTVLRNLAALLLCFSLFHPLPLNSQDGDAKKSKPEDGLTQKTIGHGKMSTGAVMDFRIYRASDGIEGEDRYAEFRSLGQFNTESATWLKPFHVESKEQITSQHGDVVGERIIASIQHTNPSGEEFLLIKRHCLVGHFIHSDSLRVALQIEARIKPPDNCTH